MSSDSYAKQLGLTDRGELYLQSYRWARERDVRRFRERNEEIEL